MEESAGKRLVVQASHYSVASLFAMIAGLVSFPLFTRVFSVEDYGAMNLIGATVSVSVAIGKVGVQHSILRYHSEISAGKSRYTLEQLYSTTLVGMVASAIVVMLGVVLAAQVAPVAWLGDERLRVFLAIASPLIVIQVVESALINVVRAEQRTALLMKYQVAKKYLGLGLICIAVLLIARSLTAFYAASVIGEAGALAVLAAVLFRAGKRLRPGMAQLSRPLYMELLGFGIPMMIGYELSGIVLSIGDRYVIGGILGEASLGLYGAAYNLCQYVQALVIVSVGQAIMPIYMQMWEQRGATETAAFVSRSLRTYVLFGAPVIAGLAAVGPELLPALASEKYAAAAGILPWVIAGMVVDGTNSMVGAGLFIHRKTRTIMGIVLSSAALNVVLNLVLVPRVGIMGSAAATLICYAAAALGMAIAGRKLLAISLPWATLARAGLVSTIMYASLIYAYPGHRLITVGARLVLGVSVYVSLMVLIDADARSIVKGALGRFRRGR
ncbi:MAG: polysaccharide biosynthesis protein [Labilithrix sp.]|nr:polysaccharide biosynthesis protein [Labilithrix sp.]